ncbi:MAG: hypothetical protein ACRDSG_03995, partial [Pseudonocardiaceae bacterium]
MFPGNTADPTAFIDAVDLVRDRVSLQQLTLISFAQIDAIKDLGGLSWITCLRAPAIKASPAQDGSLQMSLFDTHDLAFRARLPRRPVFLPLASSQPPCSL